MRAELESRWLVFNLVGMLGFAVQMAVLACLVRLLDVHYLVATAIAVEAAVLHNFCWHEHVTWRARRNGGWPTALRRLGAFHLLNGLISIGGNVALVRLLTGAAHWDLLAANAAAILACSAVNFAASERCVFRRAVPVVLVFFAIAPVRSVWAAGAERGGARAAGDGGAAIAVDLRPGTIEAWNTYDARVNGRFENASARSSPFFALDAFHIGGWRETAMRGAVAMSHIHRPDPGGGDVSVPDGRIHHWAGAIFVPNTSIQALLERLSQLAGDESHHYEDVIASRLLGHSGDEYRIYMKIERTKVITVTYNTEHLVRYHRYGSSRAGARSVSTRVAELEDAGTPREREKPVGQDGGYLWRLNAYWRYEAVNGGVLIECESLTLSRSVPALLRPFISGVVDGLARDSLERTLTGLRRILT